jgi:hypothetical protein
MLLYQNLISFNAYFILDNGYSLYQQFLLTIYYVPGTVLGYLNEMSAMFIKTLCESSIILCHK